MAATANAREVIGEATLGELEGTLRGRLMRPSDPDYDQARLVWNAAHDRRPALIIRCAGTADVMRAVEFARSEGLQLAVRSGAHSIAGYSTCDGGVVIDISPMKGIRVDPIARRAVAQAGLTWAEFDHETQAFGLAVTGGLVSSTGIAGFTLGGGIGWLLREYGLTCDSLLSADVVTADGQLVTASEHEHPELFWALRGGGGNFGVVTSMEFRLHPAGPLVFAGPSSTPARRPPRCSGAGATSLRPCPTSSPPWPTSSSRRRCRSCPRRCTASWSSRSSASRGFCRGRRQGRPAAPHLGRAPGRPHGSHALHGHAEPARPAVDRGAQNYFTGALLGGLTDETIDTLLARHAAGRAPVRELHLHHCGGAMARVPAAATAFAHRNAAYVLNIIARSPDREGFPEHVGWARATHQAVDPWTTGGAYVNFTSESGADKVQASYPPDTYARLVAVKDRYDPTNLFQLNQNIRPSGRS